MTDGKFYLCLRTELLNISDYVVLHAASDSGA